MSGKLVHRCVCLAMVCLTAVGLTQAAQAAKVTDESVEKKINQLKLYLYEQQETLDEFHAGWFGSYHKKPPVENGKVQIEGEEEALKNKNLGGPTAMAALALLVSGESSQDPRLVKSINYLRRIPTYGTYALSVKVHVWSYLPDRYLDKLKMDAEMLLGGADPNRSTWRYRVYPERDKSWDNSTNQYGILGMWQATKRGYNIPDKFWQNAANHFLNDQSDNGGWGYTANGERLTMTCAGLTCLYVVQQELFRAQDKPNKPIAESIELGMGYMHKNFTPNQHAHGGGGYYRYGVERVALASGVKYIKGQDWFEAIADNIINKGKGNTVVNASFDLMFLSRGRVPVWVNKIQLSNGAWNNRPNDMYFFSRHLSKLTEHEVNWQYVKLDSDVFEYLPAPVAWMSSDRELELSEAEKTNLKTYLDLGGMLVANQENSSSFEQSVEDLLLEFYPDYKWSTVGSNHPLGNLLFKVEDSSLPIRVLSNGARILAVMPERDWGLPLQRDEQLSKTQHGQIMSNLYAMASDRGSLPNRLVREFPKPTGNLGGQPEVWVIQAKFGKENKQGNPEPQAFAPLRNVLGPDANIHLRWAEANLADVGAGTVDVDGEAKPAAVLHIAGTGLSQGHQLTEAEQEAIKGFINAGGTVLVENVGGKSEFAVNMSKQLTTLLQAGANKLSSVDPMISGTAHASAKSVAKVNYRRYSVVKTNTKPRPRLGAINVGGRNAVVISSEDLSLGALGVRHWGINGYGTESARQILTNIILTADQNKGG